MARYAPVALYFQYKVGAIVYFLHNKMIERNKITIWTSVPSVLSLTMMQSK